MYMEKNLMLMRENQRLIEKMVLIRENERLIEKGVDEREPEVDRKSCY